MIVDPEKRTVEWLVLRYGQYAAAEGSGLIGLSAAELSGRIDWPAPA